MADRDFTALYRELRSPLRWHLRCLGASPAEAADAVQDAFAHALAAAGRQRDELAWPAWLRTVAVRSYLRSVATSRGQVSVQTMADVPEVRVSADSAAEVQARLEEEMVFSLVATLPLRQRLVFALHFEGCGTAAIAAALSMTQAAVRQNLARAGGPRRLRPRPENGAGVCRRRVDRGCPGRHGTAQRPPPCVVERTGCDWPGCAVVPG